MIEKSEKLRALHRLKNLLTTMDSAPPRARRVLGSPRPQLPLAGRWWSREAGSHERCLERDSGTAWVAGFPPSGTSEEPFLSGLRPVKFETTPPRGGAADAWRQETFSAWVRMALETGVSLQRRASLQCTGVHPPLGQSLVPRSRDPTPAAWGAGAGG